MSMIFEGINLFAKLLATVSAVIFPLASSTPMVSPLVPSVTPVPLSNQPRLEYVQQQLLQAGMDVTEVNTLLSDGRREVYPIKRVEYKAPNWTLIERKFYNPTFVARGKAYLAAHREAFDKAEHDFGIPKEVIVGIIAIETEFGVNSGSTPTFNALYSRMEQWPEDKWKAQANQLIALSQYCLQRDLDCFSIKGSYAGALGIVQFMPYSLLTWGIDGTADGVIDLYNPVDAIPSAANFLKQHGWDEDRERSIARYYGSPVGYPKIVLRYAELLSK